LPCWLSLFTSLGAKIADMLRSAGGDWSEVELQVKKTYEKQEDVKVSGKYVTEIDLQAKGWTTDMISFSKNWAKTHGYFRTSEVHGADEWRLPLDEEFANLERKGEKYEASSSTTVQDKGSLF
jgi:hypothetical protein